MLWHFTHPTRGDVTVRLASRLIANNGDVLVPALEAGEGIAVLPDFIIGDALKAGRLEVVLADWSINPSSLYIVTPPGALRPARVRVLIDYFAAALAAAPWEG
jgi:DNA-binding transcriptional LysR family regulator